MFEGANVKRILVPIDFSDATPPVIDLARQLAKGLDAEIHLVHVKELTAAAAPGALGYGLAGMPELAPMSGVPVPMFDPMPQPIPEDEDQKSKLAQWQRDRRNFESGGCSSRRFNRDGHARPWCDV